MKFSSLHKKMKFSIKNFFSIWPNLQETADLVTSTEEIINEKLHFLCSGYHVKNKSMREEGELISMWIGCFIICFSTNWEIKFAILEHSWVLLSFLYNWFDLALKSPNITTSNGLLSMMLSNVNYYLPVNDSKSSCDWLGDLYNV